MDTDYQPGRWEIPNSQQQIPNKSNNSFKSTNYLSTKPKYNSKFSALVPIGNGCDNFCSYCLVPYARGREVYRPVREIMDEVKLLVKKGYKEIFLIAQNVNSYKSQIPNFNNQTNSKLKITNSKNKQIDFGIFMKVLKKATQTSST